MPMEYFCLDCQRIFKIPRQYTETYGMPPPWFVYSGCPYCGGMYVQAKKCSQCGRYITDGYIMLRDKSFVCDNCYIEKNIAERER